MVCLPALAGVGWIFGLHGRTLLNGWVVGLRDAVLLAGLLLALIAVVGCWIGSVTDALASTFFIFWWLGWAVLGGLAAWNARHERTKVGLNRFKAITTTPVNGGRVASKRDSERSSCSRPCGMMQARLVTGSFVSNS